MIDDDGGRPPSGSSLFLAVPPTEAMLVEFPGYVRDVRAAMEVLGGEQVRDNQEEKEEEKETTTTFFFFPCSFPLSLSTSTPLSLSLKLDHRPWPPRQRAAPST